METGELRMPCWHALGTTCDFLSDNMNLPAVLTRLQQENQLSPADVRSIQAEPTPVSRAGRLLDMLRDRRRQEPYDWLVRVLREEGQDFLVEEMEEQERHWERHYGTGKQQTVQPGQQTAQTEHLEHSSDKDQADMRRRVHDPKANWDDNKTPLEVKGVFLGQTEAGKTSLLNCMMKGQGHVETEIDRTIGVDVISFHDTKNNVKYAMYDFGGHQIYHYTHRFFLTRQTLHILNVDLPAYNSEEFQERVGTWLTSVTSHVFNPAILVVGTKVDMFPLDKAEEMIAAACSSIQRDIQGAESKIQTKLKEEIQLCQNAVDSVNCGSDMPEPFYGLTMDDVLAKRESLEKLLDGRPKDLLNVQVIPVSSKTFQGIGALCDKIAEMAKDERLFPAARQEMPTSWTKLSENIKTSERTCLKVRDCLSIGAAAGMKESDVLTALSYLHVTGRILFYNHIRGMEDLVFPDPTIILTLFKQIFRHDLPGYLDSVAESLPEHTRAQFAEDRASFSKTGRASDSFMKNLLGDNIVTFNCLLPLMKHFGLCYSGLVIFPTELPAAQPDEVAHCWPEVVPSGGEEVSVTIEYSQEPPLGLPETIVSRLLSMEQTTRRLLAKDTVVVHVGEKSEDVIYRHSDTRDEIRILGEPEKTWRRAQTVVREIEACWDEFPALYSSNSVGSGETTKSLTIEAVRRHMPGNLLRLSRGSWEGPPLVTRTPTDAIRKCFIDNRLYQVSKAVGEERQLWTRLGQELGLNRSLLDNIKGCNDTQSTFQMLKIWRTKTPPGPLHYLSRLEETLQNIGKPDLAKDVQGVNKEYRDALPSQEVTSPEMTRDTDWPLVLPGEGKYLCRRTGLGVVTPYPLHVTYRSANWSDNWQEDQGWMAVGPLFSIQCEDLEGPVDILLPHVLHLTDSAEITKDDLRVVHLVGNSSELLPVTELTPSHAVVRFKKGSKFGLVGRKENVLSLSRNGLLLAFAALDDSDISRLKVYIVSNIAIMHETLQMQEREWNYTLCDYMPCKLEPGAAYSLKGNITNGEDMVVSISPQYLMFEDTFDTNKFYEPFRVEVSADIWNSTTSRLNLELLKEKHGGEMECVSQLTIGRFKQSDNVVGSDGHSRSIKLREIGQRLIPAIITDSESGLIERIAKQLDEENVQQLLRVCPISRELQREMQDSRKPLDLLKAMMKHGHIEEDNLTMLQKDMIAAGISWTAVVRNITGVPIHLRQTTIAEAVIGPKGGEVEIPHFVKLVVPAGALQQNTEMTVCNVDFPRILISRTGVHWSSGYPWPPVKAGCPTEIKVDKVLFSPAFNVNLHGAKLTGKVPVEVHTWRPSGTDDHKCIILRHDDITGWKDISAETEIHVTEDQLVINLTQCSTIVTIWVPVVLFSSAIATATLAPNWALSTLGTAAAAVTAGGYLVAQIRDRCTRCTLKCRFSAYTRPPNLNTQDHIEFHVLCRASTSRRELPYKEGFILSGDNTSEKCLFNGDTIEVHIADASGQHRTTQKLTVDAEECKLPWGQQAQLLLPRKKYLIGTITIKKLDTEDVCKLTFMLPHLSPSHQQLELSTESRSRLMPEPTEPKRPFGGPGQGNTYTVEGERDQGGHQRRTRSSQQPRKKKSRDKTAGVSVLLVCDEYCTSKGGISTINLDIARKLAAAGARVYVTVLTASEEDIRDAERDGVILLKPRFDPKSSAEPSLEWLTVYHNHHFPHLPANISCIVGHVPVTSTAARRIKEERFQHAKLAMFGHVMPEETEPHKSDEKALGVGRKEASIQDDIGKADVVFSVGARIYRHYARFLRQRHVDHHVFLPEPSKVFSDANVIFGEEDNVRKPERVILSIGRVRNVERLKGHDLTAGSIDKVAQRLDSRFTLRLRVRGIDENDFKESKRILDEKLTSGRVKLTLLPYGTQKEIRGDMENCHLVLMPSRAEPFGLVGLEAIAAGVPVLISEQSGLAEMIKELSDRLGQPTFRHCIVKMKGSAATDFDAEKWADCIEDFITNAKSEFAEARAFKEKLLASKYWEESHQKFLHVCGISDDASAEAQGGGAEADDSD